MCEIADEAVAAGEAECRFIVRATRVLARRGIWRFVAVGDGCYPLVHQTLLGFGSVYRVAYAGTAARDVPGDLTVWVTGDVRDPGLVTGSQVIRELFGGDDRPVAVLVTGVLDELAAAGEARRYVSAVMDWAPAGSFLAASLALTDGTGTGVKTAAGSANVCRTFVRGREKVPVYGQVVVLAGGQLKVPIPRSSCRPGLCGLGGDGGGVSSHHHRPGSFY